MLRRTFAFGIPLAWQGIAQVPVPEPPAPPDKETDVRLPNGKLQRDEILKSEHEKSLRDADELTRLCEDLRRDLQKEGSFVVSLQTIKKTEDIEKLAKRIRGRLKRA